MAVLNFIQAQKFVISGSGTAIGDTTIILQSMVGIDAANIVTADLGTKAYGTLEPGNGTQEEAISFTGVTQNANGTATLTGVKTCLFKSPYTETSGLAKTHAGASTFILSNDAGFYNNIMTYVNTSLSSGAVPATTSVNGIVQMSVAPVAAPTPIAVGDNDPRLVAATMAATVGNLLFPIGSLYTATVSTNPATLLGFGTWSAFGAGRVLIGAGTGTKVATISSVTSSVITATGLTNNSNNEFQTGQAVVASTTAGNLVATTTYYVIRVTNTTFSLATTLANAQNGVVKTLAGTESGTLTLTLTARTAGDTGGEENHAMSATELLSHTHTGNFYKYLTGSSQNSPTGGTTSSSTTVDSTGGNAAMNVMQPFITCYMWLRTA